VFTLDRAVDCENEVECLIPEILFSRYIFSSFESSRLGHSVIVMAQCWIVYLQFLGQCNISCKNVEKSPITCIRTACWTKI